MEKFIQKYDDKINGVLNGFDRLVFRGGLRFLSYTAGMMSFLYAIGVLLKDFGEYAERTTKRLKESSLEAASRLDRTIKYLPSSKTKKLPLAKEIAKTDGITDGLICVLSCVEPCISFKVFRDRESKKLVLRPWPRKCLHIYHYWIDPLFGFMSARIQTWFPFTIHIWINGRECLAREMDRLHMEYERRENCFIWIEDVDKAQKLMDEQLQIAWQQELDLIALKLNPAHDGIFGENKANYYWTIHQSEWASDVMFKSSSALAEIYPALAQGAISFFSSPNVMRFLGRKPHGNFKGEVVSDYKKRPEGIRVKHSVKANSVKMYDKAGSILRPETTINDPKDFKVFRPKQGEPYGEYSWRQMRKSIADIFRRAQVSQASNERYLDALASLDTDSPLSKLVEPICRPVVWKSKRVRALRPWSQEDQSLIQTISRGEFNLNGFRNRDILPCLFPDCLSSPTEKRRAAARVTRKLRLLRAHGVIRKVSKTHRYVFTKKGRGIATAILKFQNVTLNQLNKAAA